jgi:hypothetical protein
MSESNRTLIRYVPEITYGTTPVSDPGWKIIPHNSDSLNSKPIVTESARIRTDRMVQDQIKVSEENSGSVDFELSYGDFDDLLEAVMCDAWTTNVLEFGTTDFSFTLEKEFSDLTPHYMQIKGARVDKLDLSFKFGEVVKGSVAFAGQKGFQSTTSLVGAGSTAAVSANPIMAGNVDMDTVTFDGTSIATSGIVVDEITLSIANGMRPNNSLISASPVDQKKGTGRISGRMRCYASVAAWAVFTKMLANSQTSLSWVIKDAALKGYTFTLPAIKLSGNAPAAGGQDQDIMIDAEFLCISTKPTITRHP